MCEVEQMLHEMHSKSLSCNIYEWMCVFNCVKEQCTLGIKNVPVSKCNEIGKVTQQHFTCFRTLNLIQMYQCVFLLQLFKQNIVLRSQLALRRDDVNIMTSLEFYSLSVRQNKFCLIRWCETFNTYNSRPIWYLCQLLNVLVFHEESN